MQGAAWIPYVVALAVSAFTTWSLIFSRRARDYAVISPITH